MIFSENRFPPLDRYPRAALFGSCSKDVLGLTTTGETQNGARLFGSADISAAYRDPLSRQLAVFELRVERDSLAGSFFSASKRLDFFFRHGDSLITRARNDCVAYFLTNPQFTHLFWIDSDIGYSPEAAFRLLLSDHDVAAGVYPLKREEWPADGVPQGTTRQRFEELYARYTVNTGRLGEDVVLVIDADGFMKVREAPTGFMCIKRRVFDRLIAAYPELRYVPDWPEGSVPGGGVHYRFFDVTVDPETHRYLSEDYRFCRLWEKIGGEVYVDANSNLSHAGERLYTGDFGATLRSAPPAAVGAPKGQRIHVTGLSNLEPNPR